MESNINVIINNSKLAEKVRKVDYNRLPMTVTNTNDEMYKYTIMVFMLMTIANNVDIDAVKLEVLKSAVAIESDSVLKEMVNADQEEVIIPTIIDTMASTNSIIKQLKNVVFCNGKARRWFISMARKEALNYNDK